MIKIIFFDIDGTLLPLRTKTLTPSLTKALQRLQKKRNSLIFSFRAAKICTSSF